MKNKEYWNRRFLMDKALIINDAEQFLQDNLKKLFTVAAKEIESDIEALYQSFADQNNVSLAEARRIINNSDFLNVDFEEMAKHKVDIDKDLKKKKDTLPGDLVAKMEKEHENYEKTLDGYTKKGQITHLELLHVEIDKKILDMYDENQVNIYELLAKQYENTYYKEVFNTQQCIGFGKDFIALNDNAIHTAILNQYLRKDFSDTIYKHRENLSKDLRENLTVGIIRGENLNKMAKRINKRMDVGLSNAKRLVRTETAYIFEQATKKAYEACDMEEYEYLSTLDYKTSDICKTLDGKVFKVKDAMPGKNYPPMHPNCRSTTVCHFENDKVTTRLARDTSGKSYEVPSDMQYKDWYKGLSKDEKGNMALKVKIDKDKEVTKKQYNKYKEVLKDGFPNVAEFNHIKYNDSKKYEAIKQQYRDVLSIFNFKAKLEAGTANIQVRRQKQDKHTIGSSQWKKQVAAAIQNNQTPPSMLYKDVKAEDIIKGYSGKGDFVKVKNEAYPREYVTLDYAVGRRYDAGRKEYIEANRVMIHYTASGTHVIPVKEKV